MPPAPGFAEAAAAASALAVAGLDAALLAAGLALGAAGAAGPPHATRSTAASAAGKIRRSSFIPPGGGSHYTMAPTPKEAEHYEARATLVEDRRRSGDADAA